MKIDTLIKQFEFTKEIAIITNKKTIDSFFEDLPKIKGNDIVAYFKHESKEEDPKTPSEVIDIYNKTGNLVVNSRNEKIKARSIYRNGITVHFIDETTAWFLKE